MRFADRMGHLKTAASFEMLARGKALLEIIPTSNVLYGTDFPFRDGAEVIDGLAKHGFTAADRSAIDRDNALRLMPRLKT